MKEIPFLRQHKTKTGFGFRTTVRELLLSLQNRHFALVFVIMVLIGALAGVTTNINIYMTTFFWGLDTEDLRWFVLSAIGAVLAFPLVALIQRKLDKKQILLIKLLQFQTLQVKTVVATNIRNYKS